jgi:hypothetical protein
MKKNKVIEIATKMGFASILIGCVFTVLALLSFIASLVVPAIVILATYCFYGMIGSFALVFIFAVIFIYDLLSGNRSYTK